MRSYSIKDMKDNSAEWQELVDVWVELNVGDIYDVQYSYDGYTWEANFLYEPVKEENLDKTDTIDI